MLQAIGFNPPPITIIGFPNPDKYNERINITPTGSTFEYMATINGWLYAVGNASAGSQYISVGCCGIYNIATSGGPGNYGTSIPVVKNTKCYISTNMTSYYSIYIIPIYE